MDAYLVWRGDNQNHFLGAIVVAVNEEMANTIAEQTRREDPKGYVMVDPIEIITEGMKEKK